MDDITQDQWDQNQPTSWQWVLIAGVAIIILCGLSAFIFSAYTTYNNWISDRGQSAAWVAATATAEVEERLSVIEEAKAWQLLMLDTFDENTNAWMEGDIDDQYTTMTLTLDGTYVWDAVAKRGFSWRIWPRSDTLSDFYLAVDAHNTTPNRDAQYGLIFRNKDGAYFYLEISDSGYFRVLSHDNQGWDELIPSTQNRAILPGEVNHLEVASIDDTFYIRINKHFVGSAQGSSPPEGQVGLAIGLSNSGESTIIHFDNFELRAP